MPWMSGCDWVRRINLSFSVIFSRYGEDVYFGDKEYEKFSKKWTDLSEYVREIKQSFSRYYNKRA